MHVFKTSVHGSPNIGLFGYATDRYVLIGEHLPPKIEREISAVLKVPLHRARIAGTGMPGLFVVGNSRVLLVPDIIFEGELAQMKKWDIPVRTFETAQTCFGNTIVCNDHGAIVSTDYTKAEQHEIGKLLGVPVVAFDIAELKTPGALIVINGDKGIIHRDASEREVELVEKTLKVTLTKATANLGTPYLRAAMISNSHGFIIGDASGGPEIVHIDEALGYV